MAFPNFYFTPEGQPDAGEYVNPNTGVVVNPNNKCNVVMNLPCNLPTQCNTVTFSVTKDSPQFNVLDIMNSLKTDAASDLLSADKAGALDPVLTAAEKTKANKIARSLIQ